MQLAHKKQKIINASGRRVGIVVSRFNRSITDLLLADAKKTLRRCGVRQENIRVVSVAGAIEIPFALQKLAKTGKYDCLAAIGCVIRGETPHFDFVCKTVQEGTLRVSLDEQIPVGFGVATVNSVEQAKARVHLGSESVLASLELCSI